MDILVCKLLQLINLREFLFLLMTAFIVCSVRDVGDWARMLLGI